MKTLRSSCPPVIGVGEIIKKKNLLPTQNNPLQSAEKNETAIIGDKKLSQTVMRITGNPLEVAKTERHLTLDIASQIQSITYMLIFFTQRKK